ncbi:hypothetical protein DGWBC_0575 [Dehalogenimonas sp. WBC-2]|nr:hypothetical protein DGWBC_0575 [Dehalogenimonas sp. WBC-2]
MSFKKRFLMVFCSMALLAGMLGGGGVAAEDGLKYPSEVNGMQVVFVKTAENTPWLRAGETVLVLLDSASATPGEAAAKLNSYSEKDLLPKEWTIEVYGGPGVTKESMLKNRQDTLESYDRTEPIILGPAPTLEERAPTGLRQAEYHAAIAGVMDWDDGIEVLGANWYAPTVGSYQTQYSAMVVNGWTNTDAFVQAGQLFATNGSGYNVWTTSDEYHEVRYWDAFPYRVGHSYRFEVWKNPVSDGYYLTAYNWYTLEWALTQVASITGTHFVQTPNLASGSKMPILTTIGMKAFLQL